MWLELNPGLPQRHMNSCGARCTVLETQGMARISPRSLGMNIGGIYVCSSGRFSSTAELGAN